MDTEVKTAYGLYDSLVACQQTAPTPVACQSVREFNMAQQQKEKAMNTYHNVSIDVNATNEQTNSAESQRYFLRDRLSDAYADKFRKLQGMFYINDMDPPKTPSEMKDRITKGLFIIRKRDDNEDKFPRYMSASDSIQWRDPAKPANEAGFNTTLEVVKAARDTTQEDIAILEPKEALASVRAFAAAPLPN